MGEKPKAYVLCIKTFKELESIAANSQAYRIDLYSLSIDRSDLSEEQKKIQEKNKWYTNENVDFRIWEAKLNELVSKKIINAILDKYDGNILEKTLNDTMDTEVRFIGKVSEKNKRIKVTMDFEVGDDRNDTFEYSDDLKEFEKMAKQSARSVSYSGDRDVVYLEKVSAGIYQFKFENFEKEVKKEINKFVRNKLTYCLKNGKYIIPEEYIDRGEKGIEEWRDIKSSKNKSNSIENKLIKETVKAKKQYAYDSVCKVMDKVTSANSSYGWMLPRLVIDGKWNKQRIQKLATQILGTKDKQKLIEMSEQEIIDKAKEYWKQQLMNAYNKVDKLEV